MKYGEHLVFGFLLGILMALVMTAFAAEGIQSCLEPDGTITYTNKLDRACSPMQLPKVSVAPTRGYLPAVTDQVDPPIAASPSTHINDKMCVLYEEWMELSERTLGGFNRNSVRDTQRRLVLVQLFGGGFAPSSCK